MEWVIRLFSAILVRTPRLWSDKFYLKVIFIRRMGKPLRLSSPQTYNEKLQWLKLYYHNPQQQILVDKVAVKDWLADCPIVKRGG